MKKTVIALTLVCAFGLSAAFVDAATSMPTGEMIIDGKKPARFNHSKHLALDLTCGVCHHDAAHKPLDKAAIGAMAKADGLQCRSCHTATFANEKLRKPMDLFHARCKTCHSAGVKGKKGPSGCNDCHLSASAPAAPAVAPAPAAKPKKAIEGC